MEGLTHPGYIDIKGISEKAGYGDDHFEKFSRLLEKERSNKSFDGFLIFVKTDGLAEEQKTIFMDFLGLVYLKDGTSWEPSNCQHSETLAKRARDLIEGNTEFVGLKVKTRRYIHNHFWVELEGLGEKLIIDPFGVPKKFPERSFDEEKEIIPYFGPISAAPESAKFVYQKGKPLDDWGTRDLPPGFHP